jgi:hypothetical protein
MSTLSQQSLKLADSSVRALNDSGLLVFRLPAPHRVNTICGFPCQQCGETGGELRITGTKGDRLPNTPFLIIAEASKEDWAQNIEANGGPTGEQMLRKLEGKSQGYFYFVRAD